jgi:multicomponent Na+:H+ antiporter subunit B
VNRGRIVAAAVGLLLVTGGFIWGATGLHRFGRYDFRYGAIVAKDSVPDRAAVNSVVVTAFDYRAFDTLGEEFILFISVLSVGVLLRRMREEHEGDVDDVEPGREVRGSESMRWLGTALAAPIALLALSIITHGTLTPGGGFQGGVVLMSAVAFTFLGGEYALVARLGGASTSIEISEAVAAAAFALLGVGGLISTGIYFENFIDKGQAGLLTGGMIPLANIAVGAEVAAAFLTVIAELLYQRLLSSG